MTFSYKSNYDSPTLRGHDKTKRPWDLRNEIISNSLPGTKLLDIGCGTAFKLIPLINHFSAITGIDISEEMTHYARNLMDGSGKNIAIVCGDSNHLPFDDRTFDTITCMLSRWNLNEIARVIKPDGNIIIEHIGCEDKVEFKKLFGKDKHGWRGQLIDISRSKYLQSYYELFTPLCDSVSIKNGFLDTYYTEKGILELLKFTPTIRNFNEMMDHHFYKIACEKFKRQQSIELTQNRILIHAKNLRFS